MKIAILGGGVAGVSSAIALTQKGFEVTVYERTEAAATMSAVTMGAGIVVWPNAAFVLDQLGVLDEIKSASGYPSSMRRVSSTGASLGQLDYVSRHGFGDSVFAHFESGIASEMYTYVAMDARKHRLHLLPGQAPLANASAP